MFLWDTIIRRLIRIKDTIEALKVPKSNPPLVIGFVKKITKCGAKRTGEYEGYPKKDNVIYFSCIM
jgi:hypothetical protein